MAKLGEQITLTHQLHELIYRQGVHIDVAGLEENLNEFPVKWQHFLKEMIHQAKMNLVFADAVKNQIK